MEAFIFWISLVLRTSIPFLKRPTWPVGALLDDDFLFSSLVNGTAWNIQWTEYETWRFNT